MTNCRKQLLNGTELLPTHAVGRKEWNKLFVACSNITINEEMNSILASDCVNGTWFENLGEIDYNILTKKYEEYRYDRDKGFQESCHFDFYSVFRPDQRRWVKRNVPDSNLVPWEQDLVIFQ